MPVPNYTRPKGRNPKSDAGKKHGRDQHRGTQKGVQHTDFQTTYGRRETDVELFKQQFRLTGIVGSKEYDLSSIAVQIQWQDSSSDVFIAADSQYPLLGSLQFQKPALRQYRPLVDAFMDASLDKHAHGNSRWGALGIGIRCEVGYGRTWLPLWAMRVQPNSGDTSGTGQGAEQITLADGAWTLELADDLMLVGESLDDFKFTRGKKTKRKGWRCDEITAAVCSQMSIPIKQLVKGTSYFTLPAKDTSKVSPLMVISDAYQEETNRTGRMFVIRWSAPDKKHPMGALEVLPLRRNPTLLRLRSQLIDAALSRSQQVDFATVILGRAKLKEAHGKTKSITYLAHNEHAIRRFGWIHKIVDFKPVSSALELKIMTKRALAMKLVPLRSAEFTHPGIATVRRGDAIRIDLPEEGYAQIDLNAYSTPKKPPKKGKTKYTAAAILAAELADPSLFGLPDPSVLSATGAADTSTQNVLTSNTPVVVPVADQGIVFVTSAQHTVTSGSYQMDLQTQFVDVLDPLTLKAQMEANIRSNKRQNRSGATAATGSGPRWRVTASAEDDPPGTSGSCRAIQASGYSELSTNPSGSLDFAALGHLSCLTRMKITNPKNGRTTVAEKQDVGAGSSFLPVMGLYPATRAAIGLDNSGQYEVIIELADGGDLHPVRGSRA